MSRLRVTYIGNFDPPWSTENDVREGLQLLGHEVVCLQENRVKYSEIRRQALVSDLLLWTSTWDDAQPLGETCETMHQCRDRGVVTAAYHLDTFHGLARGKRPWRTNPMWSCDWVFTADGDHDAQWAEMGVNHRWMPAGVRHSAAYVGRPDRRFTCDVAFVGSNGRGYHPEWPYRQQLVDRLRSLCRARGWRFRNPGGFDSKVERGDAMNRFYASAKVTVGDSLCLAHEESRYWSDRVYEATGRCGYLIMPFIGALHDQFEGQLPMYVWGDWAGLERMIELALNGPQARAGIRQRCHELTKNNHTYKHRAQQILQEVGLA